MEGGAWYDVRRFGARGDGKTLDTDAVQRAFDACAGAGGGTVSFSGGTFRCGTLRLRSHVELCLAAGAVLLGSAEVKDYDPRVHPIRYDHHANMDLAFLYAEDAEDITITGPGTIDGNAAAFARGPADPRPVMMRLLRCRRIRLRDVLLRTPATWATNFILCDTIHCEGLDVDSRRFPNGNGLVFDSCRRVVVANCTLDTSDDSICLQASEKDVPCRGVVVSNCTMSSHYAAMKIGMLSRGDIEDVTVSNCVLHDLECAGFKVQSSEGGRIRNLLFQNVVMRNVPRPVFVTLNHHRVGRASPVTIPETGRVEGLRFDGVVMESEEHGQPAPNDGIVILGVPGHPVRDVVLRGISYRARGGCGELPGGFARVPELVGQRAEYYAFGGGLPAWGMSVRHAEGVTIQGMSLAAARIDHRPPAAFADVRGLRVEGLEAAVDPGAECVAQLEGVRGARFRGVRPLGSQCAPVRLLGSGSADVTTATDDGEPLSPGGVMAPDRHG